MLQVSQQPRHMQQPGSVAVAGDDGLAGVGFCTDRAAVVPDTQSMPGCPIHALVPRR